MSLIKCPECGSIVSSMADFCPHCGYQGINSFNNSNALFDLREKYANCDYEDICDYYSPNGPNTSKEMIILAMACLWSKDYKTAKAISDSMFNAIINNLSQNTEGKREMLLSYGLNQYAEAIAYSGVDVYKKYDSIEKGTFGIITSLKEYTDVAVEWSKILEPIRSFSSIKGMQIHYDLTDAKNRYFSLCVQRGYILSNNPSEDEISTWIHAPAIDSELLMISSAEYFFSIGNYKTAIDFYELALKENPYDPNYWGALAQAKLRIDKSGAKEIMEGLMAIDSAIILNQNKAKWHLFKANILTRIHLLTLYNVEKYVRDEIETAENSGTIESGDRSTPSTIRGIFGNKW